MPIPTIGIGASPACDGQILVTDDMAGMFTEFTPKSVKRYGDLAGALDRATPRPKLPRERFSALE